MRIVWIAALVIAFGLPAPPALAADYPLELTNIRPGMSENNRISRAYPGLEYNIRAAVIGGVYPYSFTLIDSPPGMVINASTGEISWPKPSADATPTIVVLDSEGTTVSAKWTIKVSPSGFGFVDAGCTLACGDGSMEKPWRTIADMRSQAKPGTFVYFKSGTYRVTDITRTRPGSPWERVEFHERANPVVWLAYPGATPTVDFAYQAGVETGPLIRLIGDNVYLDGFEAINAHLIGFQFESSGKTGPTFRRMRMRKLGPGIDGSNSAFIMTTTNPTPTSYMVVQDCEFSGVTGDAVTIKIYAQEKLLIEDTVHHDSTVALELKDDIRQFTVRKNRFYNIEKTGIGGNMQELTTHGEIVFNNVRAGVALDLNQNGMAKQIFVRRNTLIGRVQVRNTDSADGPFILTNNVIVSRDPGNRVHFLEVSDQTRVKISDNLVGSPSEIIVDADGNLTGAALRYLGSRGHQLAPRPR